MSTLVTKHTTTQKTIRTCISYLALTVFLFAFSRIYEQLSYGEVSFYMHYIWCLPAIGGSLLLFLLHIQPQLPRLAYNLWNSGIAILTTGFLFRGIVNLSGRSTTLDTPYWYTGILFLVLSLLSFLLSHTKKQQSTY